MPVHELSGPADAQKTVELWADQGGTSFKAFMNITKDELAAVIASAHKRGLKVTGHLCSITYGEAAGLGIDDIEHGFTLDQDFNPAKKPDTCPPTTEESRTNAKLSSLLRQDSHRCKRFTSQPRMVRIILKRAAGSARFLSENRQTRS